MKWDRLIISVILFLYFPVLPVFGWEDFYDRDGNKNDYAHAVAVSPDGTRVFAVGQTQTAEGGGAFTVRAYNASSGTVLWTRHYDREGNKYDYAYAVAVSPDGTKVFAAGSTETSAGGDAFTVRAYNASNGAVLWTQHYNREGNMDDYAHAVAVSPDGTRVFAVGQTQTAEGGGAFTVRAYNASNGTVLWTQHYNREGTLYDRAMAVAVSPDGSRVFAAGFTQTTAGGDAFTVRAYGASNGTLLWGRHYDREGNKNDVAEAVAVSPDGSRVFAAGYTQTTAGGDAFTVRAYGASNGAVLWTQHYDRQGSLGDEAKAVAVSPDGSRVFAAGYTQTTAGGNAFTVRAYDASNGAVLWTQHYDREGNLHDGAMAVAVSPDGSRVFAAGYTKTTAGGNAFTVRAYVAGTGSCMTCHAFYKP